VEEEEDGGVVRSDGVVAGRKAKGARYYGRSLLVSSMDEFQRAAREWRAKWGPKSQFTHRAFTSEARAQDFVNEFKGGLETYGRGSGNKRDADQSESSSSDGASGSSTDSSSTGSNTDTSNTSSIDNTGTSSSTNNSSSTGSSTNINTGTSCLTVASINTGTRNLTVVSDSSDDDTGTSSSTDTSSTSSSTDTSSTSSSTDTSSTSSSDNTATSSSSNSSSTGSSASINTGTRRLTVASSGSDDDSDGNDDGGDVCVVGGDDDDDEDDDEHDSSVYIPTKDDDDDSSVGGAASFEDLGGLQQWLFVNFACCRVKPDVRLDASVFSGGGYYDAMQCASFISNMTSFGGRCFSLKKIQDSKKLLESQFLSDLNPGYVFGVSTGGQGLCCDQNPNGPNEIAHVFTDLNFVARTLLPCLKGKLQFKTVQEFSRISLQELCAALAGDLAQVAVKDIVAYCVGSRTRSPTVAVRCSNVLQGVGLIRTMLPLVDWNRPHEIDRPAVPNADAQVAAHHALEQNNMKLRKKRFFPGGSPRPVL